MAANEFSSPVAIDFAPACSRCHRCGEAAEYELIAIGGSFHNMSALFCRSCGNEFIKAITGSYEQDVLVAPKQEETLHTVPSEYASSSEMPGD